MTGRKLIDHSEGKSFYETGVRCDNCGHSFVLRMPYGERAPIIGEGILCPNCGCKTVFVPG